MNFLFIHQSFPGQYKFIVNQLLKDPLNKVVALGIESCTESFVGNFVYHQYSLTRGNCQGIDPLLLDLDSKIIRAQDCALLAAKIKLSGFTPDIICAHPGWGEALFLKDIWPLVPLLCYQEFYYNTFGFDLDFDAEFNQNPSLYDAYKIRLKNANPLLMLNSSDWNVSPTKFQRSTFPSIWRNQISTIHDGIDTTYIDSLSSNTELKLPSGHVLSPFSEIVTFVNRSIEPYRGAHTFIRSIPHIQSLLPKAEIVFVGSQEGVSYGALPPRSNWKDIFIDEIAGQFDPRKVHFTGPLCYTDYLKLLHISSCHVYLTYPFVLSWSLLEAMSIGLPIVASSTAPVLEVINDRISGLLVNFFSPHEIANSIFEVISNKDLASFLGRNARNVILDNYNLEKCVNQQISLIRQVASGSI